MLDKADVEVFVEVAKKQFNIDLSFEEASKIANGLVDYFSLLGKLADRIENNNKLT